MEGQPFPANPHFPTNSRPIPGNPIPPPHKPTFSKCQDVLSPFRRSWNEKGEGAYLGPKIGLRHFSPAPRKRKVLVDEWASGLLIQIIVGQKKKVHHESTFMAGVFSMSSSQNNICLNGPKNGKKGDFQVYQTYLVVKICICPPPHSIINQI